MAVFYEKRTKSLLVVYESFRGVKAKTIIWFRKWRFCKEG